MSTIDAAAVAQLVLRERQSRDRGWWSEWADCFTADSVIDMSWFTGSGADFVAQTRLRSADGVWGRHRLSPPAVRINGDRGWAELPLGIEFHTTVGDVEADLVSYCRSQYRAQRIDGTWRIARITSIYERDSPTPCIPGTTLDRPRRVRPLPPVLPLPGLVPDQHRMAGRVHPARRRPARSCRPPLPGREHLAHQRPGQLGREHHHHEGAVTMPALALVTGASSGIGKAYAERLAADGYDLIVVGRREDRLDELATSLPDVDVRVVAADLSTDNGVDAVAELCASKPLTMLVNNAGVAHYMPIAELSAQQARELVHVKVVAPTMLTRAAVPGMLSRGTGTIINVAGMIAFSGPAPASLMPRRAVYAGTLANIVAMSQTLSAELEGTGVTVQVVCPGVVATEFHTVQGMDLSAVPRMSAQDVVTASLRGLELGEVVAAPGVDDYTLLDTVFKADLAAFGAQSPQLAQRYQIN